jgi:ATP-dependent DNA helicase DinG
MCSIEDKYNEMIKSMPDYKVRHTQLQMVLEINKCFSNIDNKKDDGEHIIILEAPTGTGKSIGYLFSGIVNAIKQDKQLVISTATKTLQNQLCEVDIPKFINNSGYNFSYALAKGRSNFLCPYQLELAINGNIGDNLFDDTTILITNLSILENSFKQNKWNGDLDKAPINIDYKTRSIITIEKDSCLNNSCTYNQKDNLQCPYFIQRNQLKNSQVIVTNHSFLIADLILGGGVILPNIPENYFLCIDEAHNFIDIAINNFSYSFVLQDIILQLDNLKKLFFNELTNTYMYAVEKNIIEKIYEQMLQLIEICKKLQNLIVNNFASIFGESDKFILNDYIEPKAIIFKDLFIELNYNISNCYQTFNKILEILKEKIKNGSDYVIESILHKLGFYTSLLNNIFLTSEQLIYLDDSKYNATAKWISLQLSNYEKSFVFNVSMTHVGNLLRDKLWSNVNGAIITSATLAINNNFNYYLYKFGLNLYKNIHQVKLESGYDYLKQSQIVVPIFKYSPEYNSIQNFNQELANYLNSKIDYDDSYGTLVIFYNKNHLLDVYQRLSNKLQNKILLQTNFFNNQKLIQQHKKSIDNGESSVIFGLNSFAEGVDLPKLYCMHVIITKLPFDTFKDPARIVEEYWYSYEKSNYFIDVSLPETCIKLIQASGRLIRSEEDYGQVTICDNRLINKNYGAYLLNSLPMFNRKYDPNFINKNFLLLKSFMRN